MQTRIPVVIGTNRLRGDATGAMVDDTCGDNLARLREVLRVEARAASVEPTKEWLGNSVSTLLRLYEKDHAGWSTSKDGTVGHVYEAEFPSGNSILMGDARTLARITH
jgi:hypothetical protein